MSQTISKEYLDEQKKLHQNPDYGVASLSFAKSVMDLFNQTASKSISDYGAGKQNLKVGLKKHGLENFEYFPYDPAFPEYGKPQPADLSVCIDVLEHIEPEFLDVVLDDLQTITTRFGFFTVHTGPAIKILSDGRNAHIIQKPASWWLPKLCQRFEIEHMQKSPGGFCVIVRKKDDS